ncbi:GNAT family N-acetyltransferase [Phytohabitans houttuyneae]|uniref:N-acetyltransferase n=1 Tax=Phytohabitans houttuyneae TaxID=1076126 RepID=A0A6V8JU43_9ACTN|nr:GNAT family N-acetyltransferase [Phytohabitans houttuyneae]GFJ76072.1 N-acetyltransferase [Phytohabitans houttuyneae]
MTELRTERLLLRHWREGDLDPWAALNADPEVRAHLGGPRTREQSAASMAEFEADLTARGWGWWAVEVVASGELAGFAGLDPVDEERTFGGIEIGWRLARSAWGHGYATEAARAVLAYGFDTLELPEIVAETMQDNVRSQAVMRRLGMTHVPAYDFTEADGRHVVFRIARP